MWQKQTWLFFFFLLLQPECLQLHCTAVGLYTLSPISPYTTLMHLLSAHLYIVTKLTRVWKIFSQGTLRTLVSASYNEHEVRLIESIPKTVQMLKVLCCILLYSLYSLWLYDLYDYGMDLWPSVFNAVKLCVLNRSVEVKIVTYTVFMSQSFPEILGKEWLRTRGFHAPDKPLSLTLPRPLLSIYLNLFSFNINRSWY